MRKLLYFFFTFMFVLGSSCQNDNYPNSEEMDDLNIPDSIMKIIKTEDLLATLCHVDTINDSTFNYRPKYGHQDETNPSTYLFKSISDKDAYSFFMHLIPYNERNKILKIGNTYSYSIDDERTIKYTYIGSSEMKAMIEFEMPEIPEIRKYIYIPVELWPYNDGNSPFSLGSVWQHVNGDNTKTKYVCVKEFFGENDPGILMTFERGWANVKYPNSNKPCLFNCASKWAWQKLQDLYEDYNMMYNDAVEEGAIPKEFTDGSSYLVGSPTISYKTVLSGRWKQTFTCTTIQYVQFKSGGFHFNTSSQNKDHPSTGNNKGSSHIEFGNTVPYGKWEQISF